VTASEMERQLVTFSMHGERYAVPIGSVREIIRYTPPGVRAAAGGIVRGMINLRGRVLPVADLSARLGGTLEVQSTTRILIVDVTNGSVGLVVDRVDGVLHVAESRIEPLPAAMADNAVGHQIVAVDDQLVMLMDPELALGSALSGSAPGRPEPAPAAAGDAAVGPDAGPPPDDLADAPPARKRRTRRTSGRPLG
jgi:purine-binding chemotaxis protein CheW